MSVGGPDEVPQGAHRDPEQRSADPDEASGADSDASFYVDFFPAVDGAEHEQADPVVGRRLSAHCSDAMVAAWVRTAASRSPAEPREIVCDVFTDRRVRPDRHPAPSGPPA